MAIVLEGLDIDCFIPLQALAYPEAVGSLRGTVLGFLSLDCISGRGLSLSVPISQERQKMPQYGMGHGNAWLFLGSLFREPVFSMCE